jgi:hypothetical protein
MERVQMKIACHQGRRTLLLIRGSRNQSNKRRDQSQQPGQDQDKDHARERVDRVQEGIVVQSRRIVEAIVDLQQRSEDEDQQHKHYPEFFEIAHELGYKSSIHAAPALRKLHS